MAINTRLALNEGEEEKRGGGPVGGLGERRGHGIGLGERRGHGVGLGKRGPGGGLGGRAIERRGGPGNGGRHKADLITTERSLYISCRTTYIKGD